MINEKHITLFNQNKIDLSEFVEESEEDNENLEREDFNESCYDRNEESINEKEIINEKDWVNN